MSTNGEHGRATHPSSIWFILFLVAEILIVAIASSQKAWASSSDRSKAVVLEVIESVFNAQNLDTAAEWIHEDLIQHAKPELPNGLDGFKAHYGSIFKRFRTYKFDVYRITGDADMVSVQGRLHGVTNGNNKINFSVSDFYRLEDGKVIEIWRVRQLIED